MPATRTSRILTNYLIDAVKSAGHERVSELDQSVLLDPDVPAIDAWSAVASAYGISTGDLAEYVAALLHHPVADLTDVPPHVAKFIPDDIAKKFDVCPVSEGDQGLVIATYDPTNFDTEQAIGFVAARTPIFAIASPHAIREAIDQLYSPERALEGILGHLDAEAADAVKVVEELQPEAVSASEAETGPVVQLCNLILRDAIVQLASDIHIESARGGGSVRFRVDGVLRHYMHLPMVALNRVVSRIKILGKIDIADRIRPQDGRARVLVQGAEYDLRISTVPTRDGEKAVIRILDPSRVVRLDDLTMTGPEDTRFRQLLGFRDGMVLVTGPTGSGKTTTMYAGIRELATGDNNIMTVEDPIEYELAAINQIQVETKQGVTFASALRAILRQDPDIIFVGEIRDTETAEMAVHGCMTGHLVLATLHTNDAMGVVSRLKDLGVDPGSLATTLRGVLAQRLIRRVCPACAESVDGAMTDGEREVAQRLGVDPVVRATGCRQCVGTGYRGRSPVTEVAIVTPELQTMIQSGASSLDLQRAAVAGGMRPLRVSAMDRVIDGTTTAEELERVLGDLPSFDEDPAPAGPEAAGAAGDHTDAVPTPEPEARASVLLVEDDLVTRKVARRLLAKDDLAVTEAVDGEEALDVLARKPDFDLMILDLSMPKLDGRQVLHEVRKSPATAGLPVIVVTGTADPEVEVSLMEEGADDYIRKPVDPPVFLARVRGTLRRAGLI